MYEDTVGVRGRPECGASPTLPRCWCASPVHYGQAHGGKGDTFCWCAILRCHIRTMSNNFRCSSGGWHGEVGFLGSCPSLREFVLRELGGRSMRQGEGVCGSLLLKLLRGCADLSSFAGATAGTAEVVGRYFGSRPSRLRPPLPGLPLLDDLRRWLRQGC